jgi:hypothetical protein
MDNCDNWPSTRNRMQTTNFKMDNYIDWFQG